MNKVLAVRTGTFAGLLLLAGHACAQASFGGCVISPENPTMVLGALGAAAASLPWLKAELKSRFGRK